jgi:hypothetical protein
MKLVGMSMLFDCTEHHLSQVQRFMPCIHKIKYEFQL